MLKAWGVVQPDDTPRLVRWLKNTFTLAIERRLSITDLSLLLDYRNRALRSYLASGSSVEADWSQLNALRAGEFEEQIESTRNRLDILYSATVTRRFMASADVAHNLDIGALMDRAGILLVNLQPSAQLDPRNARLFGTLLVSEFFDAARQRDSRRDPRPFVLIIDEAQNFVTPDLPEILAQGRKMGLNLILAHQYLDQFRLEDERLLAAIHGACRTKMVFAVGSDRDAHELAAELFPHQWRYDEVKHHDWQTKFRPIYVRERSFGRTEGQSVSDTLSRSYAVAEQRGWSEQESHGTSRARGRTRGRTLGWARGRTEGESETDTRGSGVTRTDSRQYSQAHAHGESQGTSRSITTTHGVSEAESETRGRTHHRSSGIARSYTYSPGSSMLPQRSNGHTAQHGDAESYSRTVGHTRSLSKAHAFGEHDTRSYTRTDTEAVGQSEARSRSRARSRGRSATREVSVNEAGSETDSVTASTSRSFTIGRSGSRTHTRTRGYARTTGRSSSRNVADAPFHRYEAFREATTKLYTLEEQRQRAADDLRTQARRHFVLRTPDGRATPLVVPILRDARLSAGLLANYRERVYAQSGARPPDVIDKLIADQKAALLEAAVLHSEHRDDVVPVVPKHSETSPHPRAYDDYSELAVGKRTLPKPRRPKRSS